MNSENIPDSLRFWQSEKDSFASILAGLKDAVQIDASDTDRWRKLAHVRFIAMMVQRFLDRLFVSEEQDHLAELEQHPEFGARVGKLVAEHTTLRKELSQVGFELDRVCASDAEACDGVFASLHRLVKHIQMHLQREDQLFLDCCNQDTGGEA